MKKTLLNSMLFGTASAITATSAADFVGVVKVDEEYVYVAEWTEWGSHGEKFNCTDWTPSPADIPFGFEFEQSMDCEQNQSRFKGGLTETRIIIVTEKQDNIGTNNFKTGEVVEGAWSSWENSSLDYDCSEWSPSPSEIPYGDSFTQSRDCSLDQISTRVIDEVWADGSTTFKETEDKFRTISVTRTQSEIGTQNFKTGTENIEDWSSWSNFNGLYSCSSWTPLTSDFDLGTNFVQTSDCKQDQKRTRDVYDVWADGSETFNRTETDNQTIDSSKTQDAVGTRNFKTGVESIKDWSEWSDKNGHYDCETWTPNVNTVPYGNSFTQTRDCKQNQDRNREIYDVWADGTETLNRIEPDNQTIIEEETQNAIGTQNFKTGGERADSWSEWSNSGNLFNCSSWTPLTSTVNLGESFTQTSDCKQNQIRTRDVYDIWADGTETYNRTETDNQIIDSSKTQSATGIKNFITSERSDSWGSWVNENGHYDCDTWTPNVNTVDYGDSFTQTRNCSQDQKRTRNVYDVWADGSETFLRLDTENKTISEEETQSATGTKNFKTGVESIKDWSNWTNSGGLFNCSSWTPATSTVNLGESFTQTSDCKQNQTRTRDVYDVWADGTETFNRTETGNQTIDSSKTQNATGTKNFIDSTEIGSWSSWSNDGGLFNCSSWTPLASTVDYGDSFTQTSDCKQKQKRTRVIYDVWADGSKTENRTETGNQTVDSSKTQSAIGTRNFIDSTRNASWSTWSDKNGHYDCETWTPSVSSKPYGESFTQTRDCSQDQTRDRNVYDVWADGSETLNRIETDEQTITEQESRSSIGTKNFKDSIENGSWSNWTNSGALHTCGSWSPAPSTVNLGESFTQTSDCKQTQTRSRTIYDVWADGSKTVKTTESESKLIDGSKTRSSIGTKNYKTTTENGSWSSWSNDGGLFNCSSWSPLPNTINLGESFTQTSNCKQNQKRTRVVYDVWADGSKTENRTETGTQTINASKTQSATGTKNFIQTTRTGAWSAWVDSGSHYSCDSWSPSPSTVNLGSSFTQTRDCSQDQTRDRNIYNVWKDGSETLKSTENGIQVITEEESRTSTGTKNYKTTTENGSWSAWANSGSLHSCGSWSPATSTVNLGESFTQTSNCKQNQTRSRTIYDVWADGSRTVKTTENGSQTINASKTQSATGTKNFIQTTRTANWSSWTDQGGHYNCNSWTPNPNTVNLGSSFTQTRDCSQNQSRQRNIYNVWKDGSETLKNTETENQTITEEESRSSTGTKNYKTTTENGSWSTWTNAGSLHSCGAWSPLASTINLGESFTQTSNCKQNQTRVRIIYDVWADGSKTEKTTETGNQTINASKTQSSTGTKNFISSERSDSWSSWSDTGSPYSCSAWTPNPNTINLGSAFIQERNCSQNQIRTKDVYNVWANGTETFKRTDSENKTISRKQTQGSTGTKNYIVSTRDGSWSNWGNNSNLYDCGSWYPATNTVNYGESFTQTSDCKQTQERERNVYNVWKNGSETFKELDTETRVVDTYKTQTSQGTKNHITGTNYSSWGSWTNVSSVYDCAAWLPLASTVEKGQTLNQSRSCSIDQERTRIKYDVWADGTQTQNSIETDSQVGSTDQTRVTTGTKYSETILEMTPKSENDFFGLTMDAHNGYIVYGNSLKNVSDVYKNNNGVWTKQAALRPNDYRTYMYFGEDVGIDGNSAIVGSTFSYASDPEIKAGVAYIFKRNGSTWTQQAKLKPSGLYSDAGFGTSTDINGDYAIVGADRQDGRGAAYIFKRNGSTWIQEAKLNSNTVISGERFGADVKILGSVAVVSANNAVYVFEKNGSTWTQKTKITRTDNSGFGTSIDFDGTRIAIAGNEYRIPGNIFSGGVRTITLYKQNSSKTNWEHETTIKTNGGSSNFSYPGSVAISGNIVGIGDIKKNNIGGAFVYELIDNSWNLKQDLYPSDGSYDDKFGSTVTISGEEIIVGSYTRDSKDGSGVSNNGALYIYK